jgi:2-oxo-4-hydroxy-4-carboxy-5-ureidoimidazoline decarboxylase
MTLEEIGNLDQTAFVDALGWIFEHSPWVAEEAWWMRPFNNLEALLAAMASAVRLAGRERQLALIRAHPDLGARAKMSNASVGEQAGAGLDQLSADEMNRLREWNAAYVARFGFPFILAVKGATKHDILQTLEQRLGEEPESEFQTALMEIERIAWFRLSGAVVA